MKITVDISKSDLAKSNGILPKKKGPAIQNFIADRLKLARRRQITQKFFRAEWSGDLPPVERLPKDRGL